jgi:hypothetical protein
VLNAGIVVAIYSVIHAKIPVEIRSFIATEARCVRIEIAT